MFLIPYGGLRLFPGRYGAQDQRFQMIHAPGIAQKPCPFLHSGAMGPGRWPATQACQFGQWEPEIKDLAGKESKGPVSGQEQQDGQSHLPVSESVNSMANRRSQQFSRHGWHSTTMWNKWQYRCVS
jgi:hypothetical protein